MNSTDAVPDDLPTLESVRQTHTLDAHNVIRDPGKFEAEPAYVIRFHELVMSCGADDVLGYGYEGIRVTREDRAAFPGMLDDVAGVVLHEREDGFVDLTAFESEQAYAQAVAAIEQDLATLETEEA